MNVPSLFRNRLSLIGAVLVVMAGEALLVLVIIDFLRPHRNPYLGVVTYLVLPAFFVVGALLIPVGGIWHRLRRRPGDPPRPPIAVNLNDAQHRRILFGFLGTGFVFFLLVSGLQIRAYEFTETTTFCGQTCHTVMQPEFSAYLNSPHARVPCVDCHVGPGASWWVRSKLSGTRQVLATTFNTFPRPIPGPIEDLRPAQDTCEQCHWPEKFHGAQLKLITRYSEDEANTPHQIQLLLKTGGGSPSTGASTGIHWHMNIAHEITYVARDSLRQDIPWVQVRDPNGAIRIYQSATNPMPPEERARLARRRMDCMDCHNRPSHVFPPPARSLDESLFLGRLDAALPYLKAEGVKILSQSYPTQADGLAAIASELESYYRETYPQIYAARGPAIAAAVEELQRIYRHTVFPEMGVDWKTYPSDIGHMIFPGCFRCHDGQHVTEKGITLTRSCDACHIIIAQGEGVAMTLSPGQPLQGGQAFQHPVDLGVDMSEANCAECHGTQ